ncbi:elongation factor TS-domain-containing protein [Zychaea mexicana]|uniref:elongation factor TS-domain-containing protein n=1 Tax=Zychaea mexicana TaxID=64656 RepID=UPI0022FE28C3|nr:elongation factor TS-domain-containing protein [Zychaea mexicana]KAI9495343.1 elongation factor TS-domain-containing protein [Zychaea mexicana]
MYRWTPLICQTRRSLCRHYAAAAAIKPDIKLLKQLRQETEVSMTKAKEALVKNGNDYQKALDWLEQDAQVAGTKKAQKVAGRTAGEGLISTASVSAEGTQSKSTIIELNCETDFVSRNDVFKNLASRIAATSLLLHEPAGAAVELISVESLLQSPLMPHPEQQTEDPDVTSGKTVNEIIVETIGKLGENITLRRAAIAVANGATGSYVHGGDAATGKMGGLAAVQPLKVSTLNDSQATALSKIARQVARQAVGFKPTYLNTEDIPADEMNAQSDQKQYISEAVLNQQPYLLNPDITIAEHVNKAAQDAGIQDGAAVAGYVRWEVGEGIKKKENDFANEVQKAAQGN